ncbi:fibronectin type III domain-containing protein 1-like [Maniola jurtina]|uniref:fibronectin type III domain-containing protein 1-like n=1 Tax=Maniola jurtina TaxID=191418 RepID=UPI001E68CE0F|nr:fibronectin type III domain-containing protein 1-like [Maniola jurtina]
MQQSTLHCMTSYNFNITRGGTIEVNRYMMPTNDSDAVFVDVMLYSPVASDLAVVGSSFFATQNNFVRGWGIHSFRVPGQGSFVGYLRFRGKASPDSVVLIDSFRYIAPSFNKDLCVIYKEDKSTTTTKEPTMTTTGLPSTTSTTTELLPPASSTTQQQTTKITTTEIPNTKVTTVAPTITTKAETSTTIVTTTRSPTVTPRLSISILLVKIKKFFR